MISVPDPKRLGARLADARRSAGMTQQDAADALELARTTIVAIEKGDRRTSPHELISLAKLYRSSVSDLVGRPIVSESFVPQFRSGPGGSIEDAEIDSVAQMLQGLSEDFVALETLRSMPLMRNYPSEYPTSGRGRSHRREKPAGHGRRPHWELARSTGKRCRNSHFLFWDAKPNCWGVCIQRGFRRLHWNQQQTSA